MSKDRAFPSLLLLALLASSRPLTAQAQQIGRPPLAECIQRSGDGHCARWKPEFMSVLRAPENYRRLPIRLSGFVILQCQDQTLYATREDAEQGVRLSGIRLSGRLGQLSGLTDSISHVVVDVRFDGRFTQDVKTYGGLADSVSLVKVIPAGGREAN